MKLEFGCKSLSKALEVLIFCLKTLCEILIGGTLKKIRYQNVLCILLFLEFLMYFFVFRLFVFYCFFNGNCQGLYYDHKQDKIN